MPGMGGGGTASTTTVPPAAGNAGMTTNGTMSFSMSPMTTFFSSWGTYQLQLLFSTWNINEPWQFALSWIVVALTAVVYQCLECVYHALEHGMIEVLNEKSQRMQLQLENGELDFPNVLLQHQADESTSEELFIPLPFLSVHRPRGWQLVKLTLAFVAALRYTLGLMLMLGEATPSSSHHDYHTHSLLITHLHTITLGLMFMLGRATPSLSYHGDNDTHHSLTH